EQGLTPQASIKHVIVRGSIAEITATDYSGRTFLEGSGCKLELKMSRLPNRRWRIIESSTLLRRFANMDAAGQQETYDPGIASSIAMTSAMCLATAVEFDELERASDLLSQTNFSEALLVAAREGRTKVVERLLKRGVSVDATSSRLIYNVP